MSPFRLSSSPYCIHPSVPFVSSLVLSSPGCNCIRPAIPRTVTQLSSGRSPRASQKRETRSSLTIRLTSRRLSVSAKPVPLQLPLTAVSTLTPINQENREPLRRSGGRAGNTKDRTPGRNCREHCSPSPAQAPARRPPRQRPETAQPPVVVRICSRRKKIIRASKRKKRNAPKKINK